MMKKLSDLIETLACFLNIHKWYYKMSNSYEDHKIIRVCEWCKKQEIWIKEESQWMLDLISYKKKPL